MPQTNIREKRQTFAAPLTAASPAVKEKGPNIGFVRSEIALLKPKWDKIADCLQGQIQVKKREDAYLPKPNAADTSAANVERYKAYLSRAIFYNFTRRTMDGLIGEVFSRDPLIEVAEIMRPMLDDIDGGAVTIDQQAKKGLALCLGNSGFGLLVDYPVTSAPVSLADQKAGYIRPTLIQYARGDIINWRFIQRGARKVLSLVVTAENNTVRDDGFEVTSENQWRVMQLDKYGQYVVTLYSYNAKDETYEVVAETKKPTDFNGNPFTEIPFFFCGSVNNDAVPDEPPLYDLAELNLGHYRNSADYEDSCYMVGQPTPVFSGLTEQWVKKVFEGKTIQLGSRAAVPLPIGGSAMLMQANANSMPMEAMLHKEAQAMALGAKLIESGGGANTLGQAQLDESSESSMLSTAAKNVSKAYTAALQLAAKMMYGISDIVTYSLNTDFPASRLTPNERTQLVMEWQAGAISQTEMRAGLRKAGVATLDTEDFVADLKKYPPPVMQEATNNGGKGGADNEEKKNKDSQNNGGNQNKV